MKKLLILLAFLPTLLSAQPIVDIVKGVKLSWDLSPSQNITQYRVLVGTAPGEYTDSTLLGNVTTATIPIAQPGIYYFAVTAINNLGMESVPSNEITVQVISIVGPDAPVIRLDESFQVLSVTNSAVIVNIIKRP